MSREQEPRDWQESPAGGDSADREVDKAPLTSDQECVLRWAIIDDNCPIARERLLKANERLVASMALRYLTPTRSLTGLVSAGYAGLLTAVERFDPTEGIRFSRCASWWIKHAIREWLVSERAGAAYASQRRRDARESLGSGWGRGTPSREPRVARSIDPAKSRDRSWME